MSRKKLTPAALDALAHGGMNDPFTPGLSVKVLSSGKKVWKYMRWVPSKNGFLRRTLGSYPALSIADARTWANDVNRMIDKGEDPRDVWHQENKVKHMTVNDAHILYMVAASEGRCSNKKVACRPITLKAKLDIFKKDICPKIGKRLIHDIVEDDLVKIVQKKGGYAKVAANRLLAELVTFFKWAASLRGMEVGLSTDPSRRLRDLRFPEKPRSRNLTSHELEWFLLALAEEKVTFRRGILLLLLTATGFSEVVFAKTEELQNGVWTIPSARSKNRCAHRIALGPWAQQLFNSHSSWLFPAALAERPCRQTWRLAWDRVVNRMINMAGGKFPRITPHDLRRTFRTNSRRIGIDFETAEAMLNHSKGVLVRTYDQYDMEAEKALGFSLWEDEVLRIARSCGTADALEAPAEAVVEVPSP